ncbi:MAG: 3-keto-disaccharide hydrolase [Planctomycetota bacterium]
MSLIVGFTAIVLLIGSTEVTTGQAPAKLVQAKDGSGIIGYKDTPILPWCGYHVHDPDRPAPPKVTPGLLGIEEKAGTAPSDAVVLFDGTDLSKWKPSDWKIEKGELIAVSGNLATNESFGDCQLHLEWQTPNPPQGHEWDRGNNGVMLMGLFEIQIFDTYTTQLYPDGQAASVYGQTPPMVNVCRPPGKWQSYDIIFFAPVFKDGKLEKEAYVTVLHNGLLVHHNQKIYGPTGHRILPGYDKPIPGKLPLILSAHNNPVRFRNIWIRPL